MAIKQKTQDALVGTSANRETVYHVQLQNNLAASRVETRVFEMALIAPVYCRCAKGSCSGRTESHDHTSAKNTNRRHQQSKFNIQNNEETIDLVTGVAAQPEMSQLLA